MSEAVEKLQISDIDIDTLYTEFASSKTMLSSLISLSDEEKQATCDQKWVAFFEKCDRRAFPNLYSICQYVFSIPVSNSFTERVFSIMGNIWTDERNRLDIASVKAEIQCKLNFSENCIDFYDYLKNHPKLLTAAKSNKKYVFKHR